MQTFVNKIAVVQAEPAWLDLEAGVIKTIEYIEEAAANGAKLLAFSELWIPGYPSWMWALNFANYHPINMKYIRNSMAIDSIEMNRIRAACSENKIWVYLGFAERVGSSMWMSSCFIDGEGQITNHRRKILPTACERIMFGNGTGDSLMNVISTPLGRIGSLQCWEHLQPLLKYHTYSQHEQIHVAAWPAIFPHRGHEPWAFTAQAATVASQLYAMEGQTFVLMATQVMTAKGAGMIGMSTEGKGFDEAYTQIPGGGSSHIFGPDGKILAGPMAPHEEGILYADADLGAILDAKAYADPVGHYSRPDLLRVVVDREPKRPVIYLEEQKMPEHPSVTDDFSKVVDSLSRSSGLDVISANSME
ncbi:hypothetical protein L486_05286 [Kwoniella mangroviensis CBS 10435]|uniref:CN hydrolase domain-containing protein n=1 Tax=Kwoniella mangroviensis CBS 10435 TaxID=1331196 RepID=A0A1B9IQM7_9TREE|nr:uncharacterized protein I203_08416 [Kwoniella mangroviensis CBS 8507]OCF57821.1 hypothetical protein L486_05286 [Kwoniella mangroviensis CBS 10435]OCF62521.1 hypothetical protein I203_08416 [Kwoniella mangroviensis CBS 8507]OCF75635.1 hypothetical protein I204_02927 [Kwoniella mangroviensis CBS 8886]